MKRHLWIAAAVWLILTVALEFWIAGADVHPLRASVEAQVVDEAFNRLLVLGAPVFTLVLTGLIYSVLVFRKVGDPPNDASPITSNRAVTIPWFLITTGLAVLVIFYPGLSGLRELRRDPNPDLVVEVSGEQWQWNFSYPQQGLELIDADELVLPVNRRVKFEITSLDVIHSFWIPAFRLKADAVPGLISEFYVTPTMVASYSEDINLRVQCAELCGTGHPRMRTGVRILERAEFEAWVADQGGG